MSKICLFHFFSTRVHSFGSGCRQDISVMKNEVLYDLLQGNARKFFLGFMTCFRAFGKGITGISTSGVYSNTKVPYLGQHALNLSIDNSVCVSTGPTTQADGIQQSFLHLKADLVCLSKGNNTLFSTAFINVFFFKLKLL